MKSAILTNLSKFWMGKKHDRQGPLAYIVDLSAVSFFKNAYQENDLDCYSSSEQNCGCGS